MAKHDGNITYRAISVRQDGGIKYPVPASPARARQDGVIQYVNRTARLDGVINYSYANAPVVPPPEPTDGAFNEFLLAVPCSTVYTTGNFKFANLSTPSEKYTPVDVVLSLPHSPLLTVDTDVSLASGHYLEHITNVVSCVWYGLGNFIINNVTILGSDIHRNDNVVSLAWENSLTEHNDSVLIISGVLNALDYDFTADAFSVDRYPNFSQSFSGEIAGYIPNGTIRVNNFKNTTHNGVIQNVRQGVTKSKYSPITAGNTTVLTPWNEPTNVDSMLTLTYGYGMQNFLVGGWATLPYVKEDYAIPDPITIHHPVYEVFKIMSSSILYLQPDNTVIGMLSHTITYDLDTFTWKLSVTLASQADYLAIKPNGSIYQIVELHIGTIKFKFFISTANRQTSAGAGGKVSHSYTATGFSIIAAYSAPYSPAKDYADVTLNSAAGLVQQELINASSNIVVNWQLANWSIQPGIHSYQNKTPVGAMLSVVNSVGCAMLPDPYLDELNVLPYYNGLPWHWNIQVPDHTMHISQFLNDSASSVPDNVPNTVFVYGSGEYGVGLEVGILGTQATNVLPDVVDKYITHTDAALQRGMTELSKVSRLESMPLTTYVDSTVGLFYPRQVIEVTDWDGSVWYCQVMGTSISMSNIGAVILQTLTVHKYHGA